jgi:hypothetical protein
MMKSGRRQTARALVMPCVVLPATPLSTTAASGPEALRPHLSLGLPKRALTSLRRPAQSTHLYLHRY